MIHEVISWDCIWFTVVGSNSKTITLIQATFLQIQMYEWFKKVFAEAWCMGGLAKIRIHNCTSNL